MADLSLLLLLLQGDGNPPRKSELETPGAARPRQSASVLGQGPVPQIQEAQGFGSPPCPPPREGAAVSV